MAGKSRLKVGVDVPWVTSWTDEPILGVAPCPTVGGRLAIGQTQRAEIVSGDRLQRWWRPAYALELSLLECPAFAFTLLHALWLGHEPGINGFATLSGLLMTYFGARFGVLGVYVSGRSREKQAAAPSAVGEIVRALVKKK